MNTTKAVMRMVVSMPCQSSGQVRRRFMAASTRAPTTPMAPASVGVARPMKMVPSTRKIRTSEGTMPLMHFQASGQPRSVRASGGRAGTSCGRMRLRMNTQTQNSATWIRLGPMAPRYMSPTERPSWSASTTSTSEGGMSWVMVPEAAITPVAWRTE